MSCTRLPVTRVIIFYFQSNHSAGARQTVRQWLRSLRRQGSGPANSFGDLVELFARKQLLFLIELGDRVEKGS